MERMACATQRSVQAGWGCKRLHLGWQEYCKGNGKDSSVISTQQPCVTVSYMVLFSATSVSSVHVAHDLPLCFVLSLS